MEAKEIWNSVKLNQFGSELDISCLYCDLMKKVRNCLKNYEAVCSYTFEFLEKTEEELKLIKLQLSQKLKEENYVYKIEIDKNKIEVTLYLLNISEEQYQEIQEKRKEMYLGKRKELFISESIDFPLILIYMFIEGTFLFTMIRIFNFTCAFWISAIIFIFFFSFIIGSFYDKKQNQFRKEKAELVAQFKEYLDLLNRDFCDENCKKEEIEVLHDKYYQYPSWNEFLQYLK